MNLRRGRVGNGKSRVVGDKCEERKGREGKDVAGRG